MPDFHAIARELGPRPSGQPRPVSGGCIHDSYRWGEWFIKTNSAHHADPFRAEAEGLRALAAVGTIRVPVVLGHGLTGDTAWLALEALDLASSGDEAALGEQLAALHASTADVFGFPHDNYLGSTPQPNHPTASWPGFFRDQRIGHVCRLLRRQGNVIPESDAFLEVLPQLLPADPPASLLHGDLWAGNKGFLSDGTPVLFDPAVYHGDAETDLAMTRLFGGFGPRFYQAYRHHRPAPDDEATLHGLYNLHHLLNHALLFGGGYLAQARGVMRRYL
ncbi:fructosamine kinase family protein [Haloferula sargassicola]|uniref:Ketoamine kinase HMPREF0351_12196 n=1 Tax=Haloferula sargassicola TaxID=490096 RepID=A0ABP9USQ6_9BACT